MVKKAITNFDSSKASSSDCIPVVVLTNCEPELSYIPAELFNIFLKESCFPDCWKVSSVVPVFKNIRERSTAKNYCPVDHLSVGSKVFEKLVNNKIVDHLEKSGLFLISSMVLGLLSEPQFLVLQFPYYTLMTFLVLLSVILLSMLMILLSNLNVIILICYNN